MQLAVQFNRVRRRQSAAALEARTDNPKGADACRFLPQGVPDLTRKGRDGRLAIGAGDRRNRLWLLP